jgi:hypothetical protein
VRSGEEVVATGVVDGAELELPAASYTLRVLGASPKDFANVAIESEKVREVEF